MTSFIAVRFSPNQSRTYTYRYDGDEQLAPGEMVRIPAPRGRDGWKAVEVVDVDVDEPEFACAAILGRHVEEEKEAPDA